MIGKSLIQFLQINLIQQLIRILLRHLFQFLHRGCCHMPQHAHGIQDHFVTGLIQIILLLHRVQSHLHHTDYGRQNQYNRTDKSQKIRYLYSC